jgi:hypothetical protein
VRLDRAIVTSARWSARAACAMVPTTMAHFLLDTPQGSLLVVLVASTLVAVIVWLAVRLVVAAVALTVWLFLRAIRQARGSSREFPHPETR